VVCCSVLQCVAVCCSVLQCVVVCCSVLQCVAVCCIVLQCVAVCWARHSRLHHKFFCQIGSVYVLQCVCVCFSSRTMDELSHKLQYSTNHSYSRLTPQIIWEICRGASGVCCGVLQCATVCCSALQCVAVCCSVLQCVAVC